MAIPVTTVAFESTFSTSGRVVGPCYRRLHPKILEPRIYMQDWISNGKQDTYSFFFFYQNSFFTFFFWFYLQLSN